MLFRFKIVSDNNLNYLKMLFRFKIVSDNNLNYLKMLFRVNDLLEVRKACLASFCLCKESLLIFNIMEGWELGFDFHN